MSKRKQLGRPITRREALAIARRTLARAERERRNPPKPKLVRCDHADKCQCRRICRHVRRHARDSYCGLTWCESRQIDTTCLEVRDA